MSIRKLAAGVALSAFALAASSAYAQEITGGVTGTVTENGKPISGAQITVTNVGTGNTVSTVSGHGGFYTVRNLTPGGPYTVTVTTPDSTTSVQNVDQVPIGAPADVDFDLGGTQVSEVVVTAAPAVKNASIATGPRSTFTAADIAATPSFARDLHDLARLNPFITVDEANSNALIIAGTNSHFNTIYLDGVRQSDDFGLNNSGYPTQRSPFSLEIVKAMNVEIAPYDVQYGDFEGGILNIVTKSGSNDFHGSVDYESDSNAASGKVIGAAALLLPGNTKDRAVTTIFKDQNSSLTFNGPLWKDHIFFSFGYERYEGLGSSTYVPSDVAGVNVVTGVNQAQVTAVQNIVNTPAGTAIPNITTLVPGSSAANTGYGYPTGNYGGSAPLTNIDYFGKLDYYITDRQHLWFSYQQTDGSQYSTPDGSSTSKGEINLQSSDYVYEQDLTAYTADLTSTWTDNLSTELEYTDRDVASITDNQGPLFANFLVQVPNTALPGGGSIDLGTDKSRQANALAVRDQQIKFRAHYTVGDNVITAGYEGEKLGEFDLFVQYATGQYTFNNTCGPGLNLTDGELVNLADHVACSLTYNNTATNVASTAGGVATNYTNVAYIEDEWHPTQNLTINGGFRGELYTSPSAPLYDPRFKAQYGFSNTATINGEWIVEPRLGFNWKPDPTLTISGGAGLFSGGNPGAYTYDSFDNTGNLVGNTSYSCIPPKAPPTPTTSNCGQVGGVGPINSAALTTTGATAGTPALINVNGFTIPVAVQTDATTSANLGTANANALDPHFKPPSEWKGSLSIVKLADFSQMDGKWGALHFLGDGWRAHADLLLTKVQYGVEWKDLFETSNQLTATEANALSIVTNNTGLAPDGRPLFNPNRYSQVVPLTGVGGVAAQYRPAGAYDLELTDTTKGYGYLWAIGLSKHIADWLDIDYTFTSQHVYDPEAATSSVASSNYSNLLFADPNNPANAVSNYQILFENRLTFSFDHKFFGDYHTRFNLAVTDRAGLPFSYAFCTTAASICDVNGLPQQNGVAVEELYGQFESGTSNQLLYVPKTSGGVVTANSDPLVTYGPNFDMAGFNDFLKASGLLKYAGQISPRNAFRSGDFTNGDFQISQELPALYPNGAKGQVYIDVINFLNLIDKNWGIDNQYPFPYEFAPVEAYNCQWSGQMFNVGTPRVLTMPTCSHGQGNYYEYEAFRSPQQNNATTVQTPANPAVPTWVVKFGIRYKF